MKTPFNHLSVLLVSIVFIATTKAQQVTDKGSFEAVQFITPIIQEWIWKQIFTGIKLNSLITQT